MGLQLLAVIIPHVSQFHSLSLSIDILFERTSNNAIDKIHERALANLEDSAT